MEVVRDAKLEPGESLLIVADQFEELFRYQRQAAAGNDPAEAASRAALFVSLLLQAAERFDCPVYVVLTMRSDFLGDCSQFPGLPEALSRSQYLIPRLTREQRREAIERPLHLAGIGISQPLTQQLLNDSSDEAALRGAGAVARGGMPDPLPVLQHGLMRICEYWKQAGAQGDLDLTHYDAVGGIKDALNQHAESIYEKLGAAGKVWAAKIFRCLTVTEAGRAVRRPTRLDRLYEIAGAASDVRPQRNRYGVAQLPRPRQFSSCVEFTGGIEARGSDRHSARKSHLEMATAARTGCVRKRSAPSGISTWSRMPAASAKEKSGLWRDPNARPCARDTAHRGLE